jgi:uncharacterized membrane protein YqgA involved in biofilm formation
MGLTGTLINAATIVAGTCIGMLVGKKYPEKMKETVMNGMGLVTSIIGISMALETENILYPLSGIALGAIIGEWLNIESWINKLGEALESRFGKQSQGLFAKGFVSATLLFCVGPMAIIGGIQDGLTGDFRTLAAKAAIDGFTSIAFASSLGLGVGFSALPVSLYQGAITLGAGFFDRVLTDQMVTEMTAAGGLLLFAIGLSLLEIKRMRVANLLPAIFLTPAICYLVQLIGSGAGF